MNYNNCLTVKELKVIAKGLGMKGYSALRKADLCYAIEAQLEANREVRTVTKAPAEVVVEPRTKRSSGCAPLTTTILDTEVIAPVEPTTTFNGYRPIAVTEVGVIDGEMHYMVTKADACVLAQAIADGYDRLQAYVVPADTAPASFEELAYLGDKERCDKEDRVAEDKVTASIEALKDNKIARHLVPHHTAHNNSRVMAQQLETHPDIASRTNYGWTVTLAGVTSYHHYATSALRRINETIAE
jgi:hypothetical protein